ncbi:MAG: DnaJ domain-containing protein [Thermonemataceae bacterium]|nr:DnaJ domain-containing protein [Thermonemataceae bacterium]
MITERLWNLIKSYINDAIDAALDERGYTKKEQEKKNAYTDFEEQYKKYEKYQKQSSYNYQSNQNNYSSQSKTTDEMKYYKWLELPNGASFEEIKKSYKSLMKKYHPDNFHDNETKRKTAETLSQKLNEAYRFFEKKYGKN